MFWDCGRSANEGAKFWLNVLTELQQPRGAGHLSGLRGWAERVSASD